MSNPSDIRLDEQTRNILIELVKARPVLYNDTIDRTREVIEERQQQWENIGAKLNLSGIFQFNFNQYSVTNLINILILS